MKRHLFIAGFASLAVLATPLFAADAVAKPDKAATHHMKKDVKKTTPSTVSPTSTSSATPAVTPATPAKK